MTGEERDSELLQQLKEHADNERDIACLESKLRRLHDNIPAFLANPDELNPAGNISSIDVPFPQIVDQYRAAIRKRRTFCEYFERMGYGHILSAK